MALAWVESFEFERWFEKINANGSKVWSGGARSGSSPRTGLWKNTSGYTVQLGAGDQDDLLILGGAYQVPGGGAGNFYLLNLYSDLAGAGVRHLDISINRIGAGNPATIRVYRGDHLGGGVLLGESAPFTEPPVGTWMHFEVKARLHDSAGSVVVRHDEAVILNLAGVDTKNGGAPAVFDGVEFSANYAGGLDDLYICNEQGAVNNDFQGAKRVEALEANGNGATSNGVGSDGNSVNNWQLIRDGLFTEGWSGLIYVDLGVTGDKDTYAHSDSALPAGNAVAGVFVWASAQKTDAGSRSLIPVARLAGVEADADPVALLNGTYKTVGDVFEAKPGGGGWTVADINNAEFGVKAGA